MKLTRRGYTIARFEKEISVPFGSSIVSGAWGPVKLFLRCRQFCEHVEVLQRSRVAGDLCAGRDFLEKPPHDFAAARLWKRFGKTYFIRLRDAADVSADMVAQFFFQVTRGANSCFQRYKSDNSLTL